MSNLSQLDWPSQLIVLHGADREQLRGRLQWLAEWISDNPGGDLPRLARRLAECLQPGGQRLALIAADLGELAERVRRAADKLDDPQCRQIRDIGGIYYAAEPLYEQGGRVAFLYPGEGAQYVGMFADLMAVPEVRDCFQAADQVIAEHDPATMPTASFCQVPQDPQQRQRLEAELRKLNHAMLSVLVADWAMTLVLLRLGVPVAAMAGHSAGELSALLMAGAAHAGETAGELVRSFSELEGSPAVDATLLAIGASRETSLQLLAEPHEGRRLQAELAMDNCLHQTVIVGLAEPMREVERRVQQRGLVYERLALARPYHTDLFEPLMEPLREMFSRVSFRSPQLPVYSCTTGEMFPGSPEEIRQLCLSHWHCRVEFVAMVRRMYEDGVRIFVEVGPRGNLCSFTEDILRGQPFLAVASNLQRRHGLTQLQHMAGQLAAHGVPLNLEFFCEQPAARGEDPPAAWQQPAPAEDAEGAAPQTADGVMQSYWNVMRQFLETQQDVMTQFLAGEPPAALADGGGPPEAGQLAEETPAPPPPPEAPAEDRQAAGGEDAGGEVAGGEVAGGEVAGGEVAGGEDAGPQAAAEVDPLSRPMIGEIVEMAPGQSLVMRRRLDLREDIYAGDHTVGGRSISHVDPDQHGLPIMPMTFTIEMMAEVGKVLAPELVVRSVQNLKLMRWLAFFEDDPCTIELTARRLEPDEGDLQRGEIRVLVQVRNLGNRASQDGAKYVASVGTVVLGPGYLEPPEQYTPFEMPGARPCECTLETMYMNLFHGDLFRAVDSLDVIADRGIEGTIHALPRDGLFGSTDDPQFLGDPVLMDVATHPPVAWHLAEPNQEGRILLPFEIKSMDFYGPRPQPSQRFKSRTWIVEETPRHFAHLTHVYDEQTGRMWARSNLCKFWRFYLPFRGVNFHGPKDIYYLSTLWDEALPATVRDQAACVQLPPLDDLKGPALLGAAARVTMSPEEFRRFERIDRPMDKKPQLLFGRIAAKDAIRFFEKMRRDRRLFYADVEIDVDDDGRPVAGPRGERRPQNFPNISISHTDKLVAALAADHPWVGIDVEPVERRESSFERIAFSSDERKLLDQMPDRDEAVARFWCAKEAVSKALGQGLVEGPRSLGVARVEGDGLLLLSLGPSLAGQFPEFADEMLVAWTHREGDFVVATSLCRRHSEVCS